MSDPFANLVTKAEPRQRLGIPGRPFEPVRIGFLVDFWMPDVYVQKMYVEPILLAFEEAVAEGHSIRPLELVVERAFALPQSRWENALHGLRRLREAGCVGVIGPLVSDNARTLREAINRRDPATLRHLGRHLRLVRRLLLPARATAAAPRRGS